MDRNGFLRIYGFINEKIIGVDNMGVLEVLTIVFIVLKLTGTTDWNWWLVLLPELISIGLCTTILITLGVKARNIANETKNSISNFYK